MNLQGRNLQLKSQGADVRLLQFELGLLGLDINEREVFENLFGDSTQAAVKQVQEKQRIPPTGKVDENTARRFNALVQQSTQGDKAIQQLRSEVERTLEQIEALTPDTANLLKQIERFTQTLKGYTLALETLRSFDAPEDEASQVAKLIEVGERQLERLSHPAEDDDTDNGKEKAQVRGQVTQRGGAGISSAQVRALNMGMLSARTQELGSTQTNKDGSYSIHYTREKGKPVDLVVEVLGREDSQVITRSPLVVRAAQDQVINLIVENSAYPPAAEFDEIEARLSPLLDGARIDELDSDAVSYLAAKTGISPVRISEYVQAQRFAQVSQVSAQVYYGMFRANLPVNKPALAAQDDDLLRRSITAAAEANVIDPNLAKQPEIIERAVAAVNQEMVATILEQPELPDGSASLGVFLDIAGLNDAQKQMVVRHVQRHPRRRGANFWEELAGQQGIGDRAVRAMQLTSQLGTLTANNAPLMRTLQAELRGEIDRENPEPLRALVGRTTADWRALINRHRDSSGKVILPDPFRGAELPEELYAQTIARMVEDSYPTATLAARMSRANVVEADALAGFIDQHPDFDFRSRSLPGYLRANEIQLPVEERQALERVGRLFDLSPRFDRHTAVQPLLEQGIHSAYQIRTMGEQRFVDTFGEQLGENTARKMYSKAAQKAATTASLFAHYSASFHNIDLAVLPQWNVNSTLEELVAAGLETVDFPTWEGLFGSLDFCDCQHCRSVFSPAAYLVALLKFLRDRGALDDLLDRRPEISHIELNCHNTNTTLPYIDLALEVLETFLVEGDEAYQTEGETPVLRVHPENINAEAYRILDEERVYPWTLPFSLWAEEARAYLEPLGVTRAGIMDHFNATVNTERSLGDWLPVAAERLGLSGAVVTILLDNTFRTAQWNGRTTAQLRIVQTLLDTARISFLELRQLLGTRFINADGALEVDFTVGEGEDAEFTCDLEQARIDALAPEHLSRIGRFVRLQRALGWSIHELDALLHALGGNINQAALVALSFVKELHQRLNTPLLVIASWLGDLDTHDYLTERDETARSYYASLFLNRTVGSEDELAPFEPSVLGGASLDDHEAAVLAALQIITAEELTLIRERRLDDSLLNLANLSELHRIATLKRSLKLTVRELLDLLEISGLDPFDTANRYALIELVDLSELLNTLDSSVEELNYLLRHVLEANSRIVPNNTQIAQFMEELRSGLKRIHTDFAAQPDPDGENTARMLGFLLPEADLAHTMALIHGIAGAGDLPADPDDFLDERLSLFIQDAVERGTVVSRLRETTHAEYLQPEVQQAERFALVLIPLAAHLRRINSQTLVQQMFADFLEIELDASGLLLGGLMRSTADAAQPASGIFLDDTFVQSEGEVTTTEFGDHFAMVHRLLKAALIIKRLELPTEELDWIITQQLAFGWLDMNDLPVASNAPNLGDRWERWLQMARAAALRRSWRAGQPSLFELLRMAEAGGDAAAFESFQNALADRTGWNLSDLTALIDSTHFDLDDFNADWGGADTLDHLWRLNVCFGMLRKLGVSAVMAWNWAQPGVTRATAGEIKQAARAKFTESQWLSTAEPIRDELRKKQRGALVDAVIQQLNDSTIQDANDLYAHFLMDAQINPCMQTSRIVFATGAVQLFVQRVLLNLEGPVKFSTADASMWQWMKNYRVWEANVKVFITPENWIVPELRPEKSPFFVDLQNELLQNDLTMETAELAYQNYLEKLDEIARLEVVGVFNENDTHTLHVIARTPGTPHKFFYRQWYKARRWTPWQEVPLDIEAETATPVIYNRRLYLFWFSTLEQAAEETTDEQKPNRHLEIKLTWSQYRQRKWSPKRISDAAVLTTSTRDDYKRHLDPAGYRPRPIIRPTGDLFIAVERSSSDSGSSFLDSTKIISSTGFLFIHDGQVLLSTYESPKKQTSIHLPVKSSKSWAYYYQTAGSFGLHMRGYDGSWQDVLEEAPHTFKVTVPLQFTQYNSLGPFFFADRQRTYFITPRHIWGPKPSYTGDLTIDFPHVDIFLEEDKSLLIDDILSAVHPAGVDPRPIQPGLGSLLYPVDRSPVVSAASSDTVTGIDKRILTLPTLSVVQGGSPVTGGDIAVPLMGVEAPRVLTQFNAESPILFSMISEDGAADQELMRMEVITRSTNELVVSNAVMNLGTVQGVWGVWMNVYKRSVYTFYSFYHPYVDELIKQLNRYGVEGILNPRENGEAHDLRRQLKHDASSKEFRDIYNLGDNIDDAEGMLPQEEFDFEYGRAYSVYNWELFFHIPFMIANHLSQNQRFDEARKWYHYIFDPTDNSELPAIQNRYRFWKIKPFFENTEIQTIEQLMRLLSSTKPADLEMKKRLQDQIKDWRENPFQPHLIAEQRPEAYQKAVVMRYMDNEIAHGDYLFRQDTMESVFEAIQHYILASDILGKRPERIPSPDGAPTIDGEPVRTFADLAPHLDAFGNALVQLEVEISSSTPPSGGGSIGGFTTLGDEPDDGLDTLTAEPPVHELIGSTLFFCIPQNEKLLGYWDTVEDRLFKIRNCMNIEGVVRQLALFAPPIDPDLLVRAAAAGIDLGSVLNDLNAPRPHYRFSVMLQKALELCSDVKTLGSALLTALEKRDAEDLSLLRQTHELNLLRAVKEVRKLQVDEAKEALAGLEVNVESAKMRQKFYSSRSPLIPSEKLHLDRTEMANMFDNIAQGYALVGSAMALIPEFDLGAEGGFSSPVVKAQFGGANISRVLSFYSEMYSFFASLERQAAQRAQTLAGYERRQEEWDFNAEQAGFDIEGLERQVAAAEIRIAIAEHELANHETQIEQSNEIDEFMRYKFTNRDLYSWMVTQISTVYFQCYQLAYDVAKRAEKAFQHELADPGAAFINFGYWDSLRKGLQAGDRMHYDLRRMENAYFERNKRELELTKSVSLLRIDPAALVQLRETGSCEFEIPEALFSFDYPGHYLRRLRSVEINVPCVVGPHTTVNATLTLLSNRIRTSTVDPHIPYQGVDDTRFITNLGGIQSIAASTGQNDSGLFELNLRDERYLPFEGAGAVGRWRLELSSDFTPAGDDEPIRYRSFDYDTISDVILRLRYTARDGGAGVRQHVVPALAEHVNNLVGATQQTGLFHFFSLAHEFSSDLHRFLHPAGVEDHAATLTLRRDYFPYLFQGRTITVHQAIILLKLRDGIAYQDDTPLQVMLTRSGGDENGANLLMAGMLPGGLPHAAFPHVAGEFQPEETWRLHIVPEAVQSLPAELRRTVQLDGVSVQRLEFHAVKDIGILIHFTVE